MSKNTKKSCFVITPIGNSDTPIRRHIEGIIDYAIIPALEGKFDVEVAHRKYEIGSINDGIINSIYNADLVIANLTTLNPNVMFELAIRYSFGKPVIVIAEKGTQLPFDIIDECTIFYENDPTGAYDLKEELVKYEKNIEYNDRPYGPIYNALRTAAIYKEIESGKDISNDKMLHYIIEKLESLDNKRSDITVKDDRCVIVNLSLCNGNKFTEKDMKNFSIFEDEKIAKIETLSKESIKIHFKYPMYKLEINEIIQNLALGSVTLSTCSYTIRRIF